MQRNEKFRKLCENCNLNLTWLFTPVPGENRLVLLLVNSGHVDMERIQDYLENMTEDRTDVPQCSSFLLFKLSFRAIYRISIIFKEVTILI